MSVPFVLPCLLADPLPQPGKVFLINGRLFDGTGSPTRDAVSVEIRDGWIVSVGDFQSAPPTESALVIDLGGRLLMPGIVDCHAHLTMFATPETMKGEEELRPGVVGHLVGAAVRDALRMGITTIRDVGAYGDTMFEVRQAMKHGAFRGPRLLISGRLVGATAPQGRHFPGMYREADGPDEMRKAAREQIRAGADFIKIMPTGARTVEWENPAPAQMTREEIAAVIEEAHRQGYRVAAHCEGLDGTRLAIEAGVDTVEHGFYLHQAPDLLELLAAQGGVLVPTISHLHDLSNSSAHDRTPQIAERARFNLEEAEKTLAAALEFGVPIAMGYDNGPERAASSELRAMVKAGMSSSQALVAATSVGARAVGLDGLIGTVEVGKLADLLVLDGDPIDDIGDLADAGNVHLVFQGGRPVAGSALEMCAL